MEQSKNRPIIGISALLISTLLYSSWAIFSRLINNEIPLYYQMGTRGIIALIIFIIIVVLFKQWKPIRLNTAFWLIIRSICGTFGFAAYYIGINNLSIGTAYLLSYAMVLIGGYLIGELFFHERITKIKLVSLGLALLGLFLIYSIDINPAKTIYVIIMLVSGLCTAIWNTFGNKAKNLSVAQISLLDNAFGLIFAFIISLVIHETWIPPSLTTPWIASALIATTGIITSMLIVLGFKYLKAQIGSLVVLSEILFAIIMGFLWYQEVIPVFTIIGGLLILTAIILPETNIANILNKKK